MGLETAPGVGTKQLPADSLEGSWYPSPMSPVYASVVLALLVAGCGGAAASSAPAASGAVQHADVVLPPSAPPTAEAPVAAADEDEGDATEGMEDDGPDDEASGDEVDDLTESGFVTGGLVGAEVPESNGVGGLGLSGVGLGGGGSGLGSTGLGGMGTLGHGSGAGTGQGFGSGSGRLSGSHASLPKVSSADPSIAGSYPREIIRRIIRAHINRFRYCYEKGLVKDPTLAGRVTMSFVISSDGSVIDVKATSTLSDNEVQTCIVAAFRKLSFPKPDSGVVKVTYPLLFATADASASATSTPGASSKPSLGGKAFEDVQAADLEKALRDVGCTDLTTKAGATKGAWVVSGKRAGRVFTVTLVSKQAPAMSSADLTKLQASSAVKESGGVVVAVSSDSLDASTLLLAELLR